MMELPRRRVACAVLVMTVASLAGVIAQMPNPRDMSGRPLPSAELTPGTLSVRVIRGSLDRNLSGQTVEVSVDGETRTATTGEDGRAMFSGLRGGTTAVARTTVDGERLESQPIPMGSTGMMVMLVASDPDAPEIPVVKGEVALGQESRVIVELAENGLTVFYVIEIVNSQTSRVDIGGPLIVDLPRTARGAGLLPDSTPQATLNGPRLIVTGPFQPGSTVAQVAYELPYRGPTARLEQVWPLGLPQLMLVVEQRGAMEVASPQIATRRVVNNEGQPLLLASGPAIPAGGSLVVDFTGLPHHPAWPTWVALGLALAVVGWGAWGAATAPARQA